MGQNFEIQNFAHHGFDLLDTRIAKFNHLAAIDTNEMIMLFEAKGFLVLCEILSELMFGDEITDDQ